VEIRDFSSQNEQLFTISENRESDSNFNIEIIDLIINFFRFRIILFIFILL